MGPPVTLLVFVAIPLAIVVVELVLAVLLTALGVTGRLLFRRPWIVQAASDTGERHRWRVVGWRASRVLVADVAKAVAHGNPLPPPASAPAGSAGANRVPS